MRSFWLGLLFRQIWAFLLVFISYNPSGLSYFHWVGNALPNITPLMIFLGLTLAVGWVLYIRFTLQSLRIWGVALLLVFFSSFVWLLLDWNLINANSSSSISYIALVVISVVLGIGMYWGHIQRRISGQLAIGSSPDEHHH